MKIFAYLVAALLLSDPVETSGGSGSTAPEVKSHGALRQIMHQGKTGASVRRSELPVGEGLWGVGAIEELGGEVTFVDGDMWMSRPEEKGPRTTVNEMGDPGFTLLVTSRVSKWKTLEVKREVPNAELGAYVAEQAKAAGVDLDKPFAVRVEGPLESLQWHVVDGLKLNPKDTHEAHKEKSQKGELKSGTARLVGFHSRSHAGIWTHHSETLHLHAVLDKPARVTGHVDHVVVQPGARLMIAAR